MLYGYTEIKKFDKNIVCICGARGPHAGKWYKNEKGDRFCQRCADLWFEYQAAEQHGIYTIRMLLIKDEVDRALNNNRGA